MSVRSAGSVTVSAAVAERSTRPPEPGRTRLSRLPAGLLAAFCTAYTLLLIAVGVRLRLGWDESVYLSQVSRFAPTTVLTAPRSRGIPALVAPIAATTTSVVALRTYLSIVTGAGLYLAFRPWLRLRPGFLAPLAALLFGSLWLTVFYGSEAMPNLYSALTTVTAVGLFLRIAEGDRGWAPLAGLGLSMALLALVRASDSLWVAGPMLLALLLVRRWRRLAPALAIVVGLVLGWAQWVVEAYLRWGGVRQRLHAATTENHGGLHNMLGVHVRILDGPLNCCPSGAGPIRPTAVAWWFVAAALVVVAVVAAARTGRLRMVLLPVAVAAASAASYLFLLGIANVRFLLPAYAVIAVPVAEGALAFVPRIGVRRPLAITALVAVLVAHAAVQAGILRRLVDRSEGYGQLSAALVASLGRLGVTPPCGIVGHSAPPYAFGARCHSDPGRHYAGARTPRALREYRRAGYAVAVILAPTERPSPHSYLRTWREVTLTAPHVRGWRIYLPPGQR